MELELELIASCLSFRALVSALVTGSSLVPGVVEYGGERPVGGSVHCAGLSLRVSDPPSIPPAGLFDLLPHLTLSIFNDPESHSQSPS